MVSPVVIADARCHNAESPVWDPENQFLYWSDIPRGRLYRYDSDRQEHKEIHRGSSIGGMCIQQDGALLLFRAKGTIERWYWGDFETIVADIPAEINSRFNDVVADPMGRVFCGTMATRQHPGKLYRLDLDGSLQVILEDVQIPNGMGFSVGQTQFYFTDSTSRTISRFDYDRITGELSNRRPFVVIPEGEGVPDGLTVDAEDHVWSARWDGGCLVRYSPQGDEVLRIPLPARKVSSLAFGGKYLQQLYVTTAGGQDRPTEGAGAGAVFQLEVEVQGKAEFCSGICPV